MNELQRLRVHAISQTLFQPAALKAAIRRLGFVQADPIRSPARAQDLILRHRVKGYRAGDLERRYASLEIEEDVLYAYGFVTRGLWQVLHPRQATGLSALEKKVFRIVGDFGELHPGELEAHLGRKRVVNAWGGYSKATTQALEDLHYRGLLRIARRDSGIRIYAVASAPEAVAADERLRRLILAMANLLAPAPEKTLHANIARYRRLGNPRAAVEGLIRAGHLRQEKIAGLSYVWPVRSTTLAEAPRVARFLAPFDPVVWDRRRFEHLWGWAYRFEAYTPAAKRIRGYYALPLLWRDSIVGWGNASVVDGRLNVEVGFVEKRPDERDFSSELEAEIARMAEFLGVL